MKVTFALTAAQTAIAKAIVELEAARQPDHDEVWCGNLLGSQWEHSCFNADQHLELVGHEAVYCGQRQPMVQDGAADTLARIAGYASYEEARADEWRRLHVTEYETTDQRLRWWETQETLIERWFASASLGDLLHDLECVRANPDAPRFKSPSCSWEYRLESRLTDLLMQVNFPVPGTAEYRRAVAADTLPTAEQYRAAALLGREFTAAA